MVQAFKKAGVDNVVAMFDNEYTDAATKVLLTDNDFAIKSLGIFHGKYQKSFNNPIPCTVYLWEDYEVLEVEVDLQNKDIWENLLYPFMYIEGRQHDFNGKPSEKFRCDASIVYENLSLKLNYNVTQLVETKYANTQMYYGKEHNDDRTKDQKLIALEKHFPHAASVSYLGDSGFEVEDQQGNCETYNVYSWEQAQRECKALLEESFWAFNYSFIQDYFESKIDENTYQAIQTLCEDANPIVKALVTDVDEVIDNSIQCDGRGPTLSAYDGKELELENNFLAYKQ